MNTTRKEVRAGFKSIGYFVSFQSNPFNRDLCTLCFKTADLLKPVSTSNGNVYPKEFFNEHKAAFDLANSFKGYFLTDTEQKL